MANDPICFGVPGKVPTRELHKSNELREPPCTPQAIIGDWLHAIVAARELAMLFVMNEITDMPNWTILVNVGATVAGWHRQLSPAGKEPGDEEQTSPTPNSYPLPAPPPELARHGFSDQMFDCCMSELREKAGVCDSQGNDTVRILDCDAAVFKRSLPDDFNNKVKHAMAPVEEEAREQGDYRADHGYVVLPLFHPAMYPVVHGLTQVSEAPLNRATCLSAMGSGEPVVWEFSDPRPDDFHVCGAGLQDKDYRMSTRHILLPTDVDMDQDGKCKLVSYVNNLHPKHEAVYEVIEQLLDAALPAFVGTLEAVKTIPVGDSDFDVTTFEKRRRITWPDDRWLFPCNNQCVQPQGGTVNKCQLSESFWSAEADVVQMQAARAAYNETLERWRAAHPARAWEPRLKACPPEPVAAFTTSPARRRVFPYGNGRLQVIVQSNNHILTPERPSYEGGSWHTEGMLNERIVAAAIYYYDIDNITTTQLSLRAAQAGAVHHRGNVSGGLCERYSSILEDNDLSHERERALNDMCNLDGRGGLDKYLSLGGVKSLPGRLVVFPNVLEHRVEPFELVDKTRPGHRKMIAMLLVEPALSLLSTTYVPPQQLAWMDDTSGPGMVNAKLPPELVSQVLKDIPCPYPVQVARRIREEMQKERGGGGRASHHLVREGNRDDDDSDGDMLD